MDQYRKNYLRAQKKAAEIIMLKNNNYLGDVTSADITVRADVSYVPNIRSWQRIDGYRAKESEEDTENCLKNAAYRWIRSSEGGSSVFIMDKVGGEIAVLYGSGSASNSADIFRSSVPECRVSVTEWKGHTCRYNGVIVGTMSSMHFADSFITMMDNGAGCYVACIAVQAGDEEIWDKVRENESLIRYLEKYKSFQRVYGNATRRVEETVIPEVARAIETLKEENQFLMRNAGRGFARGCVRFGAEDATTYKRLARGLRSCMNYSADDQEGFEPVRVMDVDRICNGIAECLAVPRVYVSNPICRGYYDLISWQRVTDMAEFCSMPMRSGKGFYVRNYRIDNNSSDIFPVVRPVTGDVIRIGTIHGENVGASIPISSLYSHTFVTGATRTGKTTTVKKIIKELNDRDIPALVIEAAKKEYIQLLPTLPNLRILTPGNDGQQLYINPLQVEDGTLIENHIDAVVRSITAATAGEHPIPEALEGLLRQTYKQAGWEYGMMAYTDKEKPFPTFRDAFENIPDYIRNHARYGPEVRQNLEGALTLRMENLYTGSLGRTFSRAFGITAKELLETPTVIELADFSDSGTGFLMNMLLFKLHGYLSRLAATNSLKRVIVVEEAHNIFRATLSEDTGRARNNEYFEKMLAEISASGTGMILCDQRPSIMSDAVMANTSVKITHAVSSAMDSSIMATALQLSDAQKNRLGELGRGECLIGLRGVIGVQHTSAEALKVPERSNAACHICFSRFRCRAAAVEKLLQNMDTFQIRYHIAKVQANPYNSAVLARNIDQMLADLNVSAAIQTKCCLLGNMLQKYGNISFQEARVIVNSYVKYLRGGND